MHFRVSAGAKQHPNPQLISSKLLCIPFPCSAIILTAPAQKGTSGQMHLPIGCCTAAIEQHPATRFRHLDHDAKYVTLVSTPHLCSANRSIFSTGRRSERSVQLVTRLMLLWLQKTPKVRWLARLPSSAFTAYKRHFLPRLPQNTQSTSVIVGGWQWRGLKEVYQWTGFTFRTHTRVKCIPHFKRCHKATFV